MQWKKVNHDERMLGEGILTIVFCNLFREILTDEMTIEEKPKGSKRVSRLNNLGTEHGNSKCKVPEGGIYLECTKCKEANVAKLNEEGKSRKKVKSDSVSGRQ